MLAHDSGLDYIYMVRMGNRTIRRLQTGDYSKLIRLWKESCLEYKPLGRDAKELIDFSEEKLRQDGLKIFAVLIESDNTASLALFHKAGYVLHRNIEYLTRRLDENI